MSASSPLPCPRSLRATAPGLALIVLLLSSLVACSEPAKEDPLDATATDASNEPCETQAELFKISVSEAQVDLAAGASLPITQGFQGFLFVRVGLKTTMALPPNIKMKARVVVPGEVDQVAVYPRVRTELVGGGFQTTDVPVFFNNTPLPELIGREAQVQLWTPSAGCTLSGSASVTLSAGGYMDEDASFWDQDVSP